MGRVHLPPYDVKGSVVVISVPPAMLVADLRNEVIYQNQDRLGETAAAAWDLRVYDEDEEEPDYDCPPFDGSMPTGCLGLSDVALSRAKARTIAPASHALGCPASH